MKSLLLAAIAAATALGAAAQNVHNEYGRPENFSDVVLIYAGNSNRNTWNTNQLTPYVTHKYADGREEWFFDTFLWLEFVRGRSIDGEWHTVAFGNGMGGDTPASQEDWEWILNEYITTGTGYNATKLAALDNLIGDKIKKLGQPPYRHKVIIVCPAPKKNGSAWPSLTWGTIDGQAIALNTEENRIKALKWYIDELIKRFAAAEYKNIDLEGIYWVEESMLSNASIIARVNDYARSKGLRTYWIPYYTGGNESYCQKWESHFKFDMAYYQPNYAFYKEDGTLMPKSQLNYTCAGAKKYGAGLELEFETSGTSNALHSVNPTLHQHINDYMDVYTQEGVFDEAGVAYYVGSRGLNDMNSSKDPVDHATIDRMADIVKARIEARFGKYDALEKIAVDKDWAYGGEGKILTLNEAKCYDLSGRLVHQGTGIFNCAPGVYILNDANGNTAKVIVR